MRTKDKQSNVCNYLADSQIAVTSFGNELCHCSIEMNVKIHFSVGILWLDVPWFFPRAVFCICVLPFLITLLQPG